ncbi:MAG: hypothetical protein IH897_03920 [Planctomycetes bacterium]|nr:hypothetical protein [Planctomycetota bacterium]
MPGAGSLAQFGSSVSINGNLALLGADAETFGAIDFGGAAYVYRREALDWVQETRLTADIPQSLDRFGTSVAISGTTAVVGAEVGDGPVADSGAAYVYDRLPDQSWELTTTLAGIDSVEGDKFGVAVAMDGDVIVVGAKQDDDHGSASGSAYVYRRIAGVWTQEEKLTASDADAGDEFGSTVDVSENIIVVGAPRNREFGTNSGSAYVFLWDGFAWMEEQRLFSSDLAQSDRFGSAVSVSGELVLVGAGEHDALGTNSGAAYAFSRAAGLWNEDAKILPPDGAAGQLFGFSVSIEGTLAIIGAQGDSGTTGAAYVFRQDPADDSWAFQSKLTASNPEVGDRFGSAVALDRAAALAGAPDKTFGDEDDIGAAYFFGLTTFGPDSDTDGVADACDNCINVSNFSQQDSDLDSFGDACDNCPTTANEDQEDVDADTVGDVCDNCPLDANTDQADTDIMACAGTTKPCQSDADCSGAVCVVGDGNGDACDLCPGFDDRLNCDGDTRPDACEIAMCGSAPSCMDCNENLIPDGCDIRDETSNDDNDNGVPDECEVSCSVPQVESRGPRYLAITPQPPIGPGSMKFEVSSPDWPCLSKFVGGFTKCDGTGDRCNIDADCNKCNMFLGPCLSDADCLTCAGTTNPCQTDDDCAGAVCESLQTCIISGFSCLESGVLDEIDVDRDGFSDGVVATLVDNELAALSFTAEQWGTRFRRCSISMDPCTDDADCDVGQCDITGEACSISADNCSNVCVIGRTPCGIDSECLIPDDTCSQPQTCDSFETCDYGKLYVTGEDILPSEIDNRIVIPTTYTVRAICNFPTDTVDTTMRAWADADDNGVVNFADVLLAVLGFQGKYDNSIPARTLTAIDIVGFTPCEVEQVVNFIDVQSIILAFQGANYNPDMLAVSDDCDVPCP